MSGEIRVQDIGELLEETMEEIVSKTSEVDAPEDEVLSTGLLNLDAVLDGLRPGELVCIAGASRSGRHSLACQIGISAAKQGASVLMVSAETSARQIAVRALASDARVDVCKLDAGELDDDSWERVAGASEVISGLDLRVCCNRDIGIGDVEDLVGDALEDRDKGLAVVCGVDRIAEMRGRDAGWAVGRMKAFAVGLRVPVVATVDLAESIVRCVRKGGYSPSDIALAVGGVDDECDVLMLIDRSVTPEEGTADDAPDFGTAVVAVAKNRYGACGTADLAYVQEFGRFLDLVDNGDA